MGKHQCTACKRTFRTAQGLGLHFDHARKNPKVCDGQPRIDPRDAEIARLKADWSSLRGENDALRDACRAQIDSGAAGRVAALYQRAIAAESDLARHKRALAAGPAALHYRSCDCCSIVERAQAEAMKEKP